MGKYFGTDGVRGRVGEPPITPELVLRLGYAAGRVFAAQSAEHPGETPGVLIGKDTRISGYLLEAALESGLSAAGVDVYLSGPLPTPAVAYLTRALRLSAGIVISASHNPFEDNGIKFFSSLGTKLPDTVEHAIERGLEAQIECVPSAELGKAFRVSDAAGRYIEFCKGTFPNELDLKGLKIVVDCAHGAGYHVAPHVFHELGADVVAIGSEPDGLNINALDYWRKGWMASGGVVGTVMSNLGFELALAKRGIALERTPVGDRYVLEKMVEKKWLLGGENSGHIICLDKHTTGDAIVAALAVLRALREQELTLAEATKDAQLFPQKLINVPVRRGFDWRKSDAILRAEQAALDALNGGGRVLLRPSGTEPVLRVMVEAREADTADRCARELADIVARAAG